MLPLKLLPSKKGYILLCLLFVILIYHQAISHMVFFDDSAADIAQIQGESVKLKLFYGLLSLNNSLFEYNFFQSFILPLQIVILGSIYDKTKSNYCRFYLGRSTDYYDAINKLKKQLSLINCLLFLLILILISVIAGAVGRFDSHSLVYYFQRGSLLQFFSNSTWHYLFYYAMVKCLAIYSETYLLFKMIDSYNHFLKATLAFLLFLWATAPILYSILPFYLVPMSHLMITSYGNINLWQLIASYLPCICCLLFLKYKNPNEIL